MKEAITVKNIQVSSFMKLEELKEKLLRCFKNINPIKFHQEPGTETNSLFDLRLFKIEKNQEIFNLIISHVNKNKFYKLNSEELKFTGETNSRYIKDLSFFNIKKETTIIVEVIPKNMIVKPFIRVQSEAISCSQCQAKIISRECIIYCDYCTQVNKIRYLFNNLITNLNIFSLMVYYLNKSMYFKLNLN